MTAREIKKRNRQVMGVYRHLNGYGERLAAQDRLYVGKDYLHHGLVETLLRDRIDLQAHPDEIYNKIHSGTAARMSVMHKRRVWEGELFTYISDIEAKMREDSSGRHNFEDVYSVTALGGTIASNDRHFAIKYLVEKSLRPRRTMQLMGGRKAKKTELKQFAHLEALV